MGISVHSILQHGSEGILIDAECHITNGLPAIVIVGLGGRAIDEAKERLRGAFSNAQLAIPPKRITINLAPADVPKDSTALDLAIATALLAASEQIKHQFTAQEAFLGEVSLDGSIRPIRGIIGTLIAGHELGITTFYIPQANYKQAELVPGIHLIPVSTLAELATILRHAKRENISGITIGGTAVCRPRSASQSLAQIAGQEQAKRALEIVAAGGHNILLSGPPGTGKSMLAKALPDLLPEMSCKDILEATHLHSLADTNYDHLVTTRPFRAPHHSASNISIIGGGSRIRPGEISLSHTGVLFLDEMPEFDRTTLEALRQPLEDREVTIVRANQRAVFPARFILVATANPCPCGYYGSASGLCQCTAAQIFRYKNKFSGPILDRIDLHVDVDEVDHEALLATSTGTSYDNLSKRIRRAHIIQEQRFGSSDKTNAIMDNNDLKRHSRLTPQATDCLNKAASMLTLSARSYMRLVKVARTIADLDDAPETELCHIAEALQYRPKLSG